MRYIAIGIITSTLLAQCTGKPAEKSGEEGQADSATFVTVSDAQYKAAAIAFGKIEQRPVTQHIQVSGKLDVPPQNLITVAAPMGGFVKNTTLLQGMKVNKGDVLATLENQDYIQLQQDYLDSKSKLEFLEAEYNRQQELARENVNAQKALQQAKAQFVSMKAAVSGLEAKLSMINISPASLANGNVRPSINLFAPLGGYITEVNVNIGQFVNTTDVMFRIVNLEHIHAELQVYEKDISKIAVGQKVLFQATNETLQREASIYLIGKEISPERTVRVHCHLEKEDTKLLPGMFISATIEISSAATDVVPSDCIVSFEGEQYIFVPASDRHHFEAVSVKTGNTTDEFTAITLPQNFKRETPIVTHGAFELLGLLKNQGEEE
ncbi:efflux RND transporter periplasmic adaptor subunit [Ohtaekwangia sp.]|uniref:efflux RND transporter periplasmic adaptor subunit n=1 Tax=Ohtaekwangia sp. TaxID=2066019 RepID=UPI002F93AA5B